MNKYSFDWNDQKPIKGFVLSVIFLVSVLVSAGAAGAEFFLKSNFGEKEVSRDEDHRWAVLVQYAGGLKEPLVNRYGVPEKHIYVLEPDKGQILRVLEELAGKLTEKDLLLLSSCGHTMSGCFIGLNIPLDEIENCLKRINAFKVIFQSTCHSGAAITKIPSADIVYAACMDGQFEGGVFFRLFVEAISEPELSDSNKDGKISFGEAFDYASRNDLIQKGYAELFKSNPAFWPGPTGPLPLRKEGTMEYKIWLDKNWRLD